MSLGIINVCIDDEQPSGAVIAADVSGLWESEATNWKRPLPEARIDGYAAIGKL